MTIFFSSNDNVGTYILPVTKLNSNYSKIKLNQLPLSLSKNTVLYTVWDKFIFQSTFVTTYYTRNENMWGDGFLFDFLQKKTADA